jgi:hypothetical protein
MAKKPKLAKAFEANPRATLPSPTRRQAPVVTAALTPRPPQTRNAVVMAPRLARTTRIVPADKAKKIPRRPKGQVPRRNRVDPAQALAPDRVALFGSPSAAARAPSRAAAAPAPTVVTFEGGSAGNPDVLPPDTHGAVSGVSMFTPLNNRVWFRDRNGAQQQPSVTLDAFWNDFTQGSNVSTFDPKVVFDPFTRRFIFVTCGNGERPDSCILVAVSETEDATGNWHFGQIDRDPQIRGLKAWFDYPSLGFTHDKITISLNLFAISNNAFKGVAVFAIDKASLLNPPHQMIFDQFVLRDQGFTLAPAVTLEAGVADQHILCSWTGNSQGSGHLALFELTGNVAGGTTALNRVGFLQITNMTWEETGGEIAPQKGSSRRIDVGDDRMMTVCRRDGSLHAAHTVFLGAGAAQRSVVQWYTIGLGMPPTVSEVGRIDGVDQDMFFGYPSLAVNANGDMLLGMSAFSKTMFASAAFALRRAGGTFGAPRIYARGRGAYVGDSENRWGDYSACQPDADNANQFWTIQEHATTVRTTWRTRWARITI